MNGEGKSARRIKLPLHVLAAGGSTLLLMLVAFILAWSSYMGTREVVSSAVDEDITRVTRALNDKIRGILMPAENQLDLLIHHDVARATTLSQRLWALPVARVVLNSNPLLEAWYVGYANGDFVLFRPLRTAALKEFLQAPAEASMLVQTQTSAKAGEHIGEYRYYDDAGNLLRENVRPDYVFDPRTRPWYTVAIIQNQAMISDPYLFFTTREVGTSLSRRVPDGYAVVGIDVALKYLASEVARFKVTPGTRSAIIDQKHAVLATGQSDTPMMKGDSGRMRMATLDEIGERVLMEAAQLYPSAAMRRSAIIDGQTWELISAPLSLSATGSSLRVLLAIPHDELFLDANKLLRKHLILSVALILASIPVGFWLTQQIVRPLRALADDTRAIAAFNFDAHIHRGSRIAEVDMLANSTTQMKRTISRFLDVSAALNSEMHLDRLLEVVLVDVARTAGSRSGAVYLYDDGTRTLRRSQFHGREDYEDHYPGVINIDRNATHPAGLAALKKESVISARDEHEPELLAVPLLTLNKEFVGVISLDLGRSLSGTRNGRRDPLLAFVEALSSAAAIAIESRYLLESQKKLLEGLIRLVAGAIDAKSPYTGGHCQRVPELTRMIVQAASDAEEGPFCDFILTPDDWEAVHVAAWLHDCGKMTTPEYVVDKATKLETLYNRIHEIRTRFEVLKRDAEVAYWKAIAEGEQRTEAEARLQEMRHRLDEDFAFVASCNVGGETLDPDKVVRLHEIGARRWTRTLDDRLGLSRDELARTYSASSTSLPVEESLLVDRPEHRIARSESERIAPDNPWGFHMREPDLKFNLGELHNLSVARGTLTDEERYIINEHIEQTIIMLSQLPFPRHLKDVPEIAGGHHEHMDGSGYPKGLRREQMSVPARIMAVADVFEALTAADRPYKAPKTLSESLNLMVGMVRRNHLDGDVFVLFLQSGVYMEYAKRYLNEAQIDAVDVDTLVALVRNTGAA